MIDLHRNPKSFSQAIAFTASKTGFSPRLIEKDYYCTVVLEELATLFQQSLVFKGGTSLSKVHAEFFRLSEDLDFAISLLPTAKPAERRVAMAPVKSFLNELPKRLACFELDQDLRGSNSSSQYNGRISYRSVNGEMDLIKLDVSLREEPLLPTLLLDARTLLSNPVTGQPAVNPIQVRVLDLTETYAEKVRAAVSRRDPAIRDFFDIFHAVTAKYLDFGNPTFHRLVARKLEVKGTDLADLSPQRVNKLRSQISTDLHPVLRQSEYESFELDNVLLILTRVLDGITKLQ